MLSLDLSYTGCRSWEAVAVSKCHSNKHQTTNLRLCNVVCVLKALNDGASGRGCMEPCLDDKRQELVREGSHVAGGLLPQLRIARHGCIAAASPQLVLNCSVHAVPVGLQSSTALAAESPP